MQTQQESVPVGDAALGGDAQPLRRRIDAALHQSEQLIRVILENDPAGHAMIWVSTEASYCMGASSRKLARIRTALGQQIGQAKLHRQHQVLCPGIFLTCTVLARVRTRVISPSDRMCQTGFQ